MNLPHASNNYQLPLCKSHFSDCCYVQSLPCTQSLFVPLSWTQGHCFLTTLSILLISYFSHSICLQYPFYHMLIFIFFIWFFVCVVCMYVYACSRVCVCVCNCLWEHKCYGSNKQQRGSPRGCGSQVGEGQSQEEPQSVTWGQGRATTGPGQVRDR